MLYYLYDLLAEFDLPGIGMFQYISFRSGAAIILSLIITTAFGKKMIRLLQRKQIGEEIRDLGLEGQMQKKGTPTMGGIIILSGIIIPTLLFARLDNVYILLMLITTAFLGLIGFVDDYIKVFLKNKKGLAGKFKILGQVSLGVIVVATLYLSDEVIVRQNVKDANGEDLQEIVIDSETGEQTLQFVTEDVKSTITTIPFIKKNEFDYEWLVAFAGEASSWVKWILYAIAIIFIITAVSNAANLTDGIDGLAAGTSAISGATLGILAYVSGNIIYSDYLNIMYIPNIGELTIFIAAFIGSTVGFLWYNSYPAQVFMGDTGSLALGGILAVFSVIIRKEILIPLLCGIFLLENFSVMIQVSWFKYTKRKYGEGRRVFLMSPIHHHYQKKGIPEAKITTRFWIVGIVLAVLTIVTLKSDKLKNRLVILGAGESGVGAAILGQKKGYSVFVSDLGKIKEKYQNVLSKYKIDFESGKHTELNILDADIVVKSPGIPENAPIVKQLKEKGIPVVSEIEFAGKYNNAKTICITGSNGKTTTTLLTYHILQKAGLNVGIAGNVGKSFAWQVAEENFDVYVIELSSFQLDGMFDFKADVAVLMNITPDHLDRYGYDMQNYIDSKFRIIQNQTNKDYFIYCNDDEIIQKEIKKRKINACAMSFSLEQLSGNGAGVKKDQIIINFNQNQFSMSILDLSLQGKHNTYNSMAAGIASMVFEIRNEELRESLTDFKGVEHRLESFLKVHGINFINDSKATNVNSTWYALESIHKPIIWIAGGVDKGNDYSMLNNLIKDKVKAIVCLGKSNSKLHAAFDDKVKNVVDATSMEEAVKAAYYLARNGDTVLLSPACASFDLFENYEDRGKQFKREVRNL